MKRLIFTICCVGLWSCATDTASSGTSTTPEEACAAFVKANCAKLDACSGGKGVLSKYGDEATCESRQTLSCLASLKASGIGKTANNVKACAGLLASASCWDFDLGNVGGDCAVIAGSGMDGSACSFDGQCSSGTCRMDKNLAVVGMCGATPKAGDPCDVQGCGGRGLECNVNAAGNQVCMTPVASGGTCDQDHRCGPGFTCVGLTKTVTSGTCQASGSAPGTVCDAKHETAADCDHSLGLYCPAAATATHTCVAMDFVGSGASCDVTSPGHFAVCSGGGACVKVKSTDIIGTCKAPASDGGACDSDPQKGPPCLAPAKCVPSSAGSTAGTCMRQGG